MSKNYFISTLFICSFFFLYSQEKEQEVEEVTVSYKKLHKYNVDSINLYINREDIEAMQADDLGEILKKIPGINIKSYGGLGGLKTISVRGLGSQHTNLVVDGFSRVNAQTGQIDLSQIQLDNVENVLVQRGNASEIKLPVAAQLFGNTVALSTYQSKPPTIPLQKRMYSKTGSFGQVDHQFLGKTGSKKFFGGIGVQYRHAHGKYPYSIQNYDSILRAKRENNDFSTVQANGNLHYTFHPNHAVNVYFSKTQTDQGLPGAVILYNSTSKQRLYREHNHINAEYCGNTGKQFNYRFYYSRNRDSLAYRDPNFLNNSGGIHANYENISHSGGVTASLSLWKFLQLNFGSQQDNYTLHSPKIVEQSPERQQNFSFLKSSFKFNSLLLIAQLGSQYAIENAKQQEYFALSPYAEVRKHWTKKIFSFLYYRNSFRMPTFNELYYQSVGNPDLVPEEANQIAFGNSFTLVDKKKFYIGVQSNVFYGKVENQILAIPTKNLFVWSIQNIGKVENYGTDAILSTSWKISKNWETNIVCNYNFQRSLDVSDENGATYGHQIAYSPVHTGNLDWTIAYKELGFRSSNFYSGERYSLNQNIALNRLDAYLLNDLALFYNFNLGQRNFVRMQLTVKNICNQQYAVVRNFVMPGRSILFTFRYAFK